MILHLVKFIFSKQYRKQCVISDVMCSCGKYDKCIRKIKVKDGGFYVDAKDHFRCGKVQKQIKQMKLTIYERK
jgi:D-alanine-D-alanine ligase-like ATP-grasp enzyme